jgi:hypothetical protein
MLERGGLRERALGTEVADLERLLLRRQADMISRNSRRISSVRSGTLVALARHAQHLRLALGPVEIDGVAVGVLGDADLARQAARSLSSSWMRASTPSICARSDSSAEGAAAGGAAASFEVFFLPRFAMRRQLYHPRGQNAADRPEPCRARRCRPAPSVSIRV